MNGEMSGHMPHNMGPSSSEPSGTLLAEDRRAADRVSVNAGSQQHAPADPGSTASGASNGQDINFWTEGASGSSGAWVSGSADTPFD